jgi:hypothetical protein
MLYTSPWFKLVVYNSPEESLNLNSDLYAQKELYYVPDSFITATSPLIVVKLIIFSHQLPEPPSIVWSQEEREMDLICMSRGSYIYL